MANVFDISENINASEELGIDKDKALKSVELEQKTGSDREDIHANFDDTFKFDAFKTEVRATPLLAEYSKRSPINAAIIKQDVPAWSEVERLGNKFKYQVPKTFASQNKAYSVFDLMNYDNGVPSFSTIDNDADRAEALRKKDEYDAKLKEYSKYDRNVNDDEDSFGYRAGPEVLGIAAQMIQAPVLEPAATAVGATVGGVIGSTVPVVGTAAGAFTGAVQVSSALSNFKVTAGNLYDEAYLSQPEDVKSKINQRDAYAISMIAGMVSGGIEFLPAGKLFQKAFKGINLTKVAWAEVIKEGAASNTGKALLYAWKEFKEQGLPEYFQNITEATAKVAIDPNKDLTLGELGRMSIAPENLEAAALGTLAGPSIQGASTVAKTSIGALYQGYQNSPILNNERGAIGDKPSDDKGKTLYHRSNADFTEYQGDMIWTYNVDSPNGINYGANLYTYKLSEDAKIVNDDDLSNEISNEINSGQLSEETKKYFKDNNIDAVLRHSVKGVEQVVIVNKDKATLQKENKTKPTPKDQVKREMRFILKQEIEQDKAQVKAKSDNLKTIIEVKKNISTKDHAVAAEIQDDLLPDSTNYILKNELAKLSVNNKTFKAAFERITNQQISDDKETYTVTDRQLVDLVQYNQEILNNFRIKPEGNTQSNYDTFVGKVEENKTKVSSVLDKLNSPDLTPEERASITTDITTALEGTTEGVFDPESRNQQPIFSPEIAQSLPETEVAQIETDIREARADVAKVRVEQRQKQVDQIVSLDYHVGMDERVQQIEETLDADKNGQLNLEKTFNGTNALEPDVINALRFITPNSSKKSRDLLVDDIKSKHQEQGYSAIAIDPTTLPKNMRGLLNPKANTKVKMRLRDKKVFVKGGISFDDSIRVAKALGFKDQYEMIEKLTTAPSRDELFNERKEQASIEQFKESLNDFGADKNDFLDAFSKTAMIHLREIYTVMREKTGTARQMIKRLGRIQTIDSMKSKSKQLVRKLKVRELNPAIYRRNQINFMRNAADALVKGDFLAFFSNKEKQALNTLLEADVYRAVSVLNGKYSKLAKLFRKDTQKILAQAGQEYVDLFDALRNAVEFNPKKNASIQDNLKLLEPLIQSGYAIPEAIFKMSDAKVHVRDLTYDQTVALIDTMTNVVAAAKDAKSLKLKNETLDLLDVETLIEEDLGQRADRNEQHYTDLLLEDNTSKGFLKQKYDKAVNLIGGFVHNITNFNNAMNSLTLGKEGTIYHDMFIDPLSENSATKMSDINTWHDYLGIMSKALGKDYKVYSSQKITVPELATAKFKDNVITKGHLIGMMGQIGNPNGVNVLEKDLGLPLADIMDIIEKYTTPEDARIVQSIHNYFDKVHWPKALERYKQLGMAPPEKVIASPYKIHGIDMKGGYYPINRVQSKVEKLRYQASDWVDVIKGDKILDRLYTSVLNTFDGSDIERVKNAEGRLDYSFQGLDSSVKEMIHNNAYAKTMRDIGKVLSNKNNQRNIINILGIQRFTEMLGHLETLANEKYEDVSETERNINSFTNGITRAMYVNVLGSVYLVRPMTAAKQLFSAVPMLAQLTTKSGDFAKSFSYLWAATADRTLVGQREKFKVIQHIADKNSQMRAMLNNIKDTYGSGALDFIGLEDRFKFDIDQSRISKDIDRLRNLSLAYLNYIQIDINMRMYVASYRMAIEGNINGIAKDDMQAAEDFAGSLVEKSLSNSNPLLKSEFQKTNPNWMFAGSQALISYQAVYSAIDIANREGKIKPSEKWLAYSKAAMLTALYGSSFALLTTALKEAVSSFDSEEEKKKQTDMSDYLYDLIFGSLDQVPVVSDLKYQFDEIVIGDRDPRTFMIGTPVTRMFIDFGKMFMAALDEDKKFSRSDYKQAFNVTRQWTGIPREGTSFLFDIFAPSTKPQIINEGASNDTGINIMTPYDAMQSNQEGEETPKQEKSSILKEINDKLKSIVKLGDDDMRKEMSLLIRNSIVRDITNPEGNEIKNLRWVNEEGKAVKRDLVLSDKEHDETMLMIDAISRYETLNHTRLENPDSSARGYLQFVQKTWKGKDKDGNDVGVANNYPELNLPDKVEDATKYDQYAAMWKITGEHFLTLEKLGLPRSVENLYLLHLLGRGTFKTLSNLDDSTDIKAEGYHQIFSVDGNPKVYGRSKSLTVKDLKTRLRGQLMTNIDQAVEYASENDYLTYIEP